MRIAIIAVTQNGAALSVRLAAQLQAYGCCTCYAFHTYAKDTMVSFDNLSELTRTLFSKTDALVFVSACGIAVRSIAPYVQSKQTDPAVLCIDEGGHTVISLLSGHLGGANRLAALAAEAIGAQPVITTATDTGRLFSPDSFAKENGLHIVEMDMAKRVAAALLNGEAVGVVSAYPCRNMPAELSVLQTDDSVCAADSRMQTGICISEDAAQAPFAETLHLVPKNLTIGVGCRKGIAPALLEQKLLQWLDEAKLPLDRIQAVASIDLKKDEPAIQAFCEKYRLPLQLFDADQLAAATGIFSHSAFVAQTTGVDNVCERSAVLGAGGGTLLVRKHASDGVTMAVAEAPVQLDFGNKAPEKKLYVVGFGAGGETGMTTEARQAIQKSDLVVGYTVYVSLLEKLFPNKRCLSTGMRQETERVQMALAEAAKGQTVALVCSGDSGVYGMACLALELGEGFPQVDIEIVPGVTAALSGGAVLGAPLTHDFAVISLSDLLTPWEKISRRLHAAAEADFVVVLYNPSSKKRAGYLKEACEIMLAFKSPKTVCGYVRNIGREGEEAHILTLEQLKETQVDMFTTVFIGNSETREINGRMVTPRGYRLSSNTCSEL